MSEENIKLNAEQLRRPHGEMAIQVGEKMNVINTHIHNNTFEALHITSGDIILEIGMGNGKFVNNLFKIASDIQYIGCDFSKEMVEASKKNNLALIDQGKAEFHFADAAHLPLSNASVNKIFTINTLYFWENPTVILNEFFRVLQPNGLLTITIRPKSVMQHYPFVQYGFTMYSKEELIQLLTQNNFSTVDIMERDEPDMEVNGEKMPTATLLVIARKNTVPSIDMPV